jgi:hypothetical protein
LQARKEALAPHVTKWKEYTQGTTQLHQQKSALLSEEAAWLRAAITREEGRAQAHDLDAAAQRQELRSTQEAVEQLRQQQAQVTGQAGAARKAHGSAMKKVGHMTLVELVLTALHGMAGQVKGHAQSTSCQYDTAENSCFCISVANGAELMPLCTDQLMVCLTRC